MNTQRWLALGLAGLVVGIILARPLLFEVSSSDEPLEVALLPGDSASTPAPFVTATPPVMEDEESEAPPFIPTRVETLDSMTEDSGGASAMMEDAAMASSGVASGPFLLAQGNFVQIDSLHGGEGTATIYQGPDGKRFVRLEPFGVTDAPDLRVALSSHPAPRTQADLQSATTFLDLGALQSTSGAQNYEFAATVRLEQFQSVVVYDRQFNIVFTTATLER